MKVDNKYIWHLKIMSVFLLLILISTLQIGEVQAQSIDDYLQMAAENNPKLQSAYAEFEAALQQSPQVASLPDPTLTVSAFGRMIETRVGRQEARINFMQMFPWFGTLKAKEDAANLMAESGFYKYLDVRNQVFFDIKSLYAEIYALEKTIDLQREQLKILDSYKDLALSQFKNASAPMVNVVKIDIKKDELQTEIELLEELKQPLQSQFNLLLNRGIAEEIQVQDTMLFEMNAVLGNENFEDHPTVALLNKQEEAYNMQKVSAKKEGLPTIGLGFDYSIISPRDVENLEGNGRDAIMPMVSITLPIYRKKYKASIKQAELMGESVERSQKSRLNELRGEYESTKYDLLKAEKKLNLYDRQIQSSKKALKLLSSGFSNSISGFDELLQMNQDLIDFETQKIEAIKAGIIAEAKMDYLFSKKEEYED
jgi:outer membrane protein TolC